MNNPTIKNWSGRLLVAISTILAEVVSGSIFLSRIQLLPGQFFVYGSAIILIREIARRLQASWPTILLLGWAFVLTLEGLTLQTLFNPVYLGNVTSPLVEAWASIGFGRLICPTSVRSFR
jgi:hypothetical protein